jgi:two-component system sensor histidine kinase MprB
MSLRARLTLLVAVCVAAAVVAASSVAYFATQDRLVSAVDDTLEQRATFEAARPVFSGGRRPPGDHDFSEIPGVASIDIVQVIGSDGSILDASENQDVLLPVDDQDSAVAAGSAAAFFRTETIDGEEYRIYTAPTSGGEAVQVARPLREVNGTLADLRNILLLVSAGGVGAATILGLVVAHRALRPVARLTSAAEHVAATQDLSHSIETRGSDEIARLGASFNTMLAELNASREQQRRLVADASHELRTPLTSLRTNIEVLAAADDLPAEERRQILNDATFEIAELTKIVAELVDLATDLRAEEREHTDVRLDEVVHDVVRRARRRTGVEIELDADPTVVVGNHDLLERAVHNLIENACKWSPPERPVEVSVRDGRVEVRDYGPGIPAEDLPFVFDRFFRSADARAKPGSGLGLSIVKQIVEAHGGIARVERAAREGTRAWFSLPPVDVASPGSAS